MSSAYAKYTRPITKDADGKESGGEEAVLLADPLTRAAFERKGFTYVGPAEQAPGNEAQNLGRNGGMFGRQGYDATAVVKQATEVVIKKLTGTYTAEEASAERAAIRSKMSELGAFPAVAQDVPEGTLPPTEPVYAPLPAEPTTTTDGATTTTDGATTTTSAPDLSATPKAAAKK